MKKIALVTLLVLLMSGCATTHLQVVDFNSQTGRFPTEHSATVVTNESFDIDERSEIVVVPSGGFTKSMVENINYFREVATLEEIEKAIVREDLIDQVPSLTDRIGLSRAARAYKPFMLLHWDERSENGDKYLQLKLVDPLSLDELFVAETYLDFWVGTSDERNRYPLFNSLAEYLRENSEDY